MMHFKTFHMKYAGFILIFWLIFLGSCNRQEKGIDLESLHFSISSIYGTHYITNYEIPFYAVDSNGNNITPSVIFYIDGHEIEGTAYTFSQPGTHTISAKWDLGGVYKEADNTITAEVIPPRHATYVIIEDFTGTWCVNCPRVHYKLEQLLSQNDHVYGLAIHDKGHESDPFHFDQVNELTSAYNILGYPTPLLNRTEVWDEESASVNSYLQKVRPAGIKIENTYDGNTLDLVVKVRFDMDLKKEKYRLIVLASENGLHADQANATSYYGGQNPIPNLEHNHVLRHAFTSVLGDPIPADACIFDNEYQWHYTGSLPASIQDSLQTEFTAMLLKGDEAPIIINAKQTPINTSTGY